MRKHGSLTNDEETNAAAMHAARGAVVGAARVRLKLFSVANKAERFICLLCRFILDEEGSRPMMFMCSELTRLQWGFYTAVIGLGAYAFSPLYRGFTFQFKV